MIDKLFRKVSSVQIAMHIAASIAMIIDNIIVGKFLGITAVGAYGAAAPLLLVIMSLNQVLSTGGQIKCGEALGKGNKSGADAVVSLVLFIGVSLAALIIIICFTFQEQVLFILGVRSGSELYNHTLDYLLGFILGAPGFIGMLILVPFIQLDGDKNRVMRSTVILIVTDVIGDIAAIKIFNSGMFGIGLASSVSYYCAMAFLLLHFKNNSDGLRPSLKLVKAGLKNTLPIIKLGAPAALQKTLISLLSLTLNYILIYFGGAVSLGIFTVIGSLLNLLNAVGQGMGAAVLLLSSVFYAEEDKRSLKEVIKAFIKYSVLVNAVMFIIVCFTAESLVQLFTRAKDIDINMAGVALRFAVLDLILFSLANCFKNYFQGIKNIKLTYIMILTQAFLFAALSAFPLMKFFGVIGVSCAFAAGDLLTLIMLYLIVYYNKKDFRFKLDNFMMLKDDFGVQDNNYYGRSVSSIEEAAEAAAEVGEFVESRAKSSESKNIKNKLSLCTEEICKNNIAYGLSNKDKQYLKVSLIYKDNKFILRIRDDFKKYNPVESYKKYINNNSQLELEEKYGLKIIFGMLQTDNVDYMGTLGFNTLIVKCSDI